MHGARPTLGVRRGTSYVTGTGRVIASGEGVAKQAPHVAEMTGACVFVRRGCCAGVALYGTVPVGLPGFS